jgi:isopenicillin N synthase-like dioxygenase
VTIIPDTPAISQFKDHCYHLTLKLLSLIGLGLGVDPPNFFAEAHLRSKGPSGTILRFLRYPPRSALSSSSSSSGSDSATPPPEDGDVRAGAHSDYGSLTLLFRLRGQPGLEILLKDGKTWAPVPVVPPSAENDPAPPILVNIGDLLSYWTNGLLRSTVHRVVFPSSSSSSSSGGVVVDGETDVASPRYSIAYFCHPHHAAELTPVPSERVKSYQGGLWEGNPYSERRVMTAEEHLKMRLRESYEGLYGGEAEKKKG